MAFKRTFVSILPVLLILFALVPLYSQQSTFQMSLMSPAVSGGSFTSLGISADIVETRDESYLKSVARQAAEKSARFQPSPSNLLIEQAEERFKSGRKYYRVKDGD